MEWVIYKHTAPSGNIYIGQTCKNPNYRWSNGNGYKHAPKFWNAIKKYGWNNITHEIIESGIKEQKIANEREIYWIKFYDSYKHGYNATLGGDSQEHNSIPILMIDKRTLEVLKEFPSASEAGRELNCTQGEISSVCRGERIEARGYYWCIKDKWFKDWKPRKKEYFNKRNIYQIDEHTLKIVNEYDTIIDAVKTTGLTKAIITNCCDNQYTPVLGYYWCYKEDWYEGWKPKIKKPSKHGMRAVVCVETGDEYESINEAARIMNSSPGNIFSCCQSMTKVIRGYHFSYKENLEIAKAKIEEKIFNKKIRCIEIGTVFNSMAEASKMSGIADSQICECCSGKLNTAGDLHWCYEKDYKPDMVLLPSPKRKVRCVETGIVYNSQADALRETGIRHITECCRRQIPMAGGYHWCYDEDWNENWKPLEKKDKKKIVCVETGVIYDSMKEAANATGANYTELGKCCKNSKYTTGGYHWKYLAKQKD